MLGVAFTVHTLLIGILYEENRLLAPDNKRKSYLYQHFLFEKPFG